VAVQKRIGDIALVHKLTEQASQVLEEDSIVLSQVLYGATHCGDSIPVEQMAPLQANFFGSGVMQNNLTWLI
jgi:hypothetical protein